MSAAPPITQRIAANRGLPLTWARSLVAGVRERHRFDHVETYCMFIGYPRSGHSLVGSLLDAHPEAVIAHELDALRYLIAGFRRNQIFSLILENDREFTAGGRQAKTGSYEYLVPNQYQGKVETLRVIGDKRGGRSTVRLQRDPKLIDRIQRLVRVPMRVVHVVRNPYDNISTIYTRRGKRADLRAAIDFYFSSCETNEAIKRRLAPDQVIDVRHEDVIGDPMNTLLELCNFVGLDAPEQYRADCASILFSSPRQTRHNAPWTPELIAEVDRRIAAIGFLEGYTFES